MFPTCCFSRTRLQRRQALKEKREDRRYRHGTAIVESKRWMRALDRGDTTDRLDPGTPSNQILRYLSAAEVASDRAIRCFPGVTSTSTACLSSARQA